MNDKIHSQSHDDLADRIMDLALREKAGGKRPPDLTAQILARAEQQVSLPDARRGESAGAGRRRLTPYLASACLLSLATLLAVLIHPDLASLDRGPLGWGGKPLVPQDGDLLRAYEEEESLKAEFDRKLGPGSFFGAAAAPELEQEVRAAVIESLVNSRLQMRIDQESAKRELKLLLESVARDSELDDSFRQRLVDTIAAEIPGAARREIEIAAKNAAAEQARWASLPDEERQEKMAEIVEEFNLLIDQERYAEAEVLANQGKRLDPQSPVAQNLLSKSRFVRRIQQQSSIRDRAERGFIEALSSVDEARIPMDDRDAIMSYPDAGVWEELTSRRMKYKSMDTGITSLPSGANMTATGAVVAELRANISGNINHNGVVDIRDLKTQVDRVAKLNAMFGRKLSEMREEIFLLDDSGSMSVHSRPYSEATVWTARRGSAERKIYEALVEPTVHEFDKTPLKDAIEYFKDLHGIEIQLDEQALHRAGVKTDKPVSGQAKGVSLHASLDQLLGDFGLTYRIKNEVLQITTPEAAGYQVANVKGNVTAVADGGKLVELSLGTDDGLQVGRVLNAGDGQSERRTALRVVKATPDRAVAVVVVTDGRENVVLAKGAVLAGKVFDLPRVPEFVPEIEPADEPDPAGDKFDLLPENDFELVKKSPQSTFSIDVDTASYSKVRQFLMQAGQLPPAEAVRLEELVNYFPYDYAPPQHESPFAAHVETAACPWNGKHRLVRIGIKGKVIAQADRPACNLVFLVDVSGSMNEPNKLPLVTNGLKMLAGELTERDRVAIVVYAGAAGMVLPPTRGDAKPTIYTALSQLQAGGSTNGGEGIELAYKTCQENFIEGGANRVILCTDGDFNVGVTSTGQLVDLAKEKAQKGVFLSVLGFGMGNHNDEMLEAVSKDANGNHAFIDSLNEAKKVLVRQISGTLVTIAKDVKIQVDFNPAEVESYRLLGYENRMLATEDFEDDKKDAGEIGGGHTVTALYEVVPTLARRASEDKAVQPAAKLLTLKLRYKQPDGDKSTLMEIPARDTGRRFAEASPDFQFAASVASFGMLLRKSKHAGDSNLAAVAEIAAAAKGADPHGYRAEFVELVKKAAELSK